MLNKQHPERDHNPSLRQGLVAGANRPKVFMMRTMIRYSYMFIDTRAIFSGDLSPTFDLVRSCGYEGVELNLFPGLIEQSDRLQQALDTNGLTVPSVLTGAAYNDGLCLSSADQSVRQGAVEYLLDCLEIAQRFQSILVVGLLQGLRSDEPDPVVANRRIVDGLQRVGASAEKLGVELVIEPINHLQVGFNNSVSEVRELIAAVGSPAFKPMVDTIHMNIEETSLTEPIHDCGAELRHVHLCESNGAALGSGHIDFAAVLRALNDIAYDGFASVKVYRMVGVEEAATASIEYLRRQT